MLDLDTIFSFVLFLKGFQKRVLYLLTEIRDSIANIGHKYDQPDCDSFIEKIEDIDQLSALEAELADKDARNTMVCNF